MPWMARPDIPPTLLLLLFCAPEGTVACGGGRQRPYVGFQVARAGAPMEEEDAEQTAAQTGPSPTPHSGNRAQRCDLTLPCAINALRALDDFFYAAAPREDADDALGAKQDGALVATARCEWLRLLGSCSTLLAGMHAVALAAEQLLAAVRRSAVLEHASREARQLSGDEWNWRQRRQQQNSGSETAAPPPFAIEDAEEAIVDPVHGMLWNILSLLQAHGAHEEACTVLDDVYLANTIARWAMSLHLRIDGLQQSQPAPPPVPAMAEAAGAKAAVAPAVDVMQEEGWRVIIDCLRLLVDDADSLWSEDALVTGVLQAALLAACADDRALDRNARALRSTRLGPGSKPGPGRTEAAADGGQATKPQPQPQGLDSEQQRRSAAAAALLAAQRASLYRGLSLGLLPALEALVRAIGRECLSQRLVRPGGGKTLPRLAMPGVFPEWAAVEHLLLAAPVHQAAGYLVSAAKLTRSLMTSAFSSRSKLVHQDFAAVTAEASASAVDYAMQLRAAESDVFLTAPRSVDLAVGLAMCVLDWVPVLVTARQLALERGDTKAAEEWRSFILMDIQPLAAVEGPRMARAAEALWAGLPADCAPLRNGNAEWDLHGVWGEAPGGHELLLRRWLQSRWLPPPLFGLAWPAPGAARSPAPVGPPEEWPNTPTRAPRRPNNLPQADHHARHGCGRGTPHATPEQGLPTTSAPSYHNKNRPASRPQLGGLPP
eukprot:XP_001693335.1 predicted protein [Chlamydomonas reinhardtii]